MEKASATQTRVWQSANVSQVLWDPSARSSALADQEIWFVGATESASSQRKEKLNAHVRKVMVEEHVLNLVHSRLL